MLTDLFLPDATALRFVKFTRAPDRLTLVVTSTQREVTCPQCTAPATRVHSHYRRTLADLPCSGRPVSLHLQVRRFYCPNAGCSRVTFAERLPSVVAPSARRTRRLAAEQEAIGFELGGEAGARLAQRQGMPVSPDTLLRLVRKRTLAPVTTPRVLGVDDWAKRKGKSYGTLLVDLEHHRVVDLLPERTAEALATWLQAHPGVEIIARDRSTIYADGARQGAPAAIQVADRWHLLKNLLETVEAVLVRHHPQLSRPLPTPAPVLTPTPAAVSAAGRLPFTQVEQVRLQRRAARLARYNQVWALRAQGLKVREIAQQVGISERTVNYFLAADAFPERKRRHAKQPGLLAAHLAYLNQRWTEGCTNGTQLWRELCGQGFRGSLSLVLTYVATLRTSAPVAPPVRRYTPRQAALLFLRPPTALTAEEQQDLAHMHQAAAELATTYQVAQDFAQMLRQRRPEALEPWLTAAQAASGSEFRRFAAGLRQDQAAVQAALQYSWSSGQTEGQITRLKLIKRQMYGRANFDLLRQRVLVA